MGIKSFQGARKQQSTVNETPFLLEIDGGGDYCEGDDVVLTLGLPVSQGEKTNQLSLDHLKSAIIKAIKL